MSTGRFNNVSAASIWEHLAFFLGYLTIAVVLLAPMSLSPANRLADDGDSLQGLWIIWWGSSHLFPELGQLFDANSYYPHPLGLAYSEPMLTEAILVWAAVRGDLESGARHQRPDFPEPRVGCVRMSLARSRADRKPYGRVCGRCTSICASAASMAHRPQTVRF